MPKLHQAPARLEDVTTPPSGSTGPGLIRSFRRRVPASVTALAGTLAALYVADALGIKIPGRDYTRSVFGDPIVFLFVRLAVIVVLAAIMAVAVWYGLSVAAYIHHRLWVSRPGGFEPQAIHRGATEIEGGVDDVWRVLEETKDRNAELMAALARTNRRLADLEAENAELRDELNPGHQLSLGNGD